MYDVGPRLDARLSETARAWLAESRAKLAQKGPSLLPVLWPQLARRVGRDALGGEQVEAADAVLDLQAWRACDAAGWLLLADVEPVDDLLVDLCLHGDIEERTILLRNLALLPVTAATTRLLAEVQRTNTVVHYEAGVLDSNLAVRALRAGGDDAGFTREDFHRLVLKLAFLDLPAWRMFGALDEASPELSAMLLGYATEREAAGRPVWVDTWRFIGRAPASGAVSRLVGGLEHGADDIREAAAEGLLALGRPDLAPLARERLAREPRARIRALLERLQD